MSTSVVEAERYFFLAVEAHERPAARLEFEKAMKTGLVPWGRLVADGAAPYMLFRLQRAGLEHELPEHVREALHNAFLRHAGRNIVFLRELDRVVTALNRVSITPVLLKGAALLNEIYSHPGHRGLSDLDLLVLKEELDNAGGALAALGYSLSHRKGHHMNYSARLEFPVVVELHHSLFNTSNPLHRFAFGLDAKALARRAVPLSKDSWQARTFQTEDQLLFLCCHAVKEQFGSLKLLADIYEIIKSRNVDWKTLFSRSSLYKVNNSIYTTLEKLLTVTSLEIPESGHVAGLRAIGERTLRAGVKNTYPPGKGNLAKLLFYMNKIDGPGRKAEAIIRLPVYFIRKGADTDDE